MSRTFVRQWVGSQPTEGEYSVCSTPNHTVPSWLKLDFWSSGFSSVLLTTKPHILPGSGTGTEPHSHPIQLTIDLSVTHLQMFHTRDSLKCGKLSKWLIIYQNTSNSTTWTSKSTIMIAVHLWANYINLKHLVFIHSSFEYLVVLYVSGTGIGISYIHWYVSKIHHLPQPMNLLWRAGQASF